MFIDKAIEILEDLVRDQPTFSPDDRRDAVKLGIEALKRLKDIRHFGEFGAVHPLPGETKRRDNEREREQ